MSENSQATNKYSKKLCKIFLLDRRCFLNFREKNKIIISPLPLISLDFQSDQRVNMYCCPLFSSNLSVLVVSEDLSVSIRM